LEMEKLYVRFSRECIKVILDSAAWFLKEWHIMTYEFEMFSLAWPSKSLLHLNKSG
jgi:hypothetical protein